MASTSAADAATASGSSENDSKTSDPGGGNNCSIGLNLRVTGYCNQGGRKYMEDVFSVAYQQTPDEKDLEYAFFGIFDGHGGREAAVFAKEHLMDTIVKQKGFWAVDDDSQVLRAIHEGFIQTHLAMRREVAQWPKTSNGLPSTAGTTASVAFIRRGKIYVGHVGDSAIVIGAQSNHDPNVWEGTPLTRDHKPESEEEQTRIERAGGKVVSKSGVPRVVWNRPKMGHRGPVRRSTVCDEIPFLAVARSLGDLWSYNPKKDVYVVSPEPDVHVYPIDIDRQRCLILGTDGAWNMLTPEQAVSFVCQAEKSNEANMLGHLRPNPGSAQWVNPSKYLVDCSIDRWMANNLRADNTSIVTVMLDPPGPPRAQVLKRQRLASESRRGQNSPPTNQTPPKISADPAAAEPCSTTPDLPGGSPPSPPPALPPKPSSAHPRSAQKVGVDEPSSSSQHVETKPSEDSDIQVSEISSTEEPSVSSTPVLSTSPSLSQRPPPPLSRRQELPAKDNHNNHRLPVDNHQERRVSSRKSLSRELSALQLNSPQLAQSSRPRRSGMGGPMEVEGGAYQGGGGDRRQTRRSGLMKQNNAENEGAGRINQLKQSASISRVGLRSSDNTVVKGDAEVEAKMKKLNSKIKSIERKLVRKTSELNQEVGAIQQRLVAATKEAKIEASKAKNSHGQLGNRKSTSRLQQQLRPLLDEPQNVASEASPGACARSLRPRSGLVTPNPKAVSGIPKPSQYKQQQQSTQSPSGRKRKAVLDGATSSSADKHDTPSKSPKTVFPAKPSSVATRSSLARKARLVTIKK